MAKSKKKKYKKKKNPNRAPQSGGVKKSSSGGGVQKAASGGGKSAASASDANRRKQMWIAVAVAVGVFLLLLLITQLTKRNDAAPEKTTPDMESVESGDAVADEEAAAEGEEADAASVESGDSVASGDAVATTQSGDATTASGDAVATTASGDAATAPATTDSAAAAATDSASATTDSAAATTVSGDAAATDSASATTDSATDNNASAAATQTQAEDEIVATEYADIVVKDYGTITVALDGATAPITTQNFVSLAKSGFYDGLTFHRIMDGFMIQGGDPDGNGTGGADKNIVGEFQSNGFVNNISHTRGTISMARASGDENSASSQFFIVQTDSAFLDGDYAAFGRVTSGMEVVDKICKDAKPTDNNGSIKPEEQPIIESVTIRDN